MPNKIPVPLPVGDLAEKLSPASCVDKIAVKSIWTLSAFRKHVTEVQV